MKYVRIENIVARSVAGENLLIPVRGCTDRVFTLNGAGRRLWDLLAAPHTATELAEALVARFGIPVQTAADDVERFLGKMMRMGLISARKEQRNES